MIFGIVYLVIAILVAIIMYGVSMAGGNIKWWEYILGVPFYGFLGLLWGPWLILALFLM